MPWWLSLTIRTSVVVAIERMS